MALQTKDDLLSKLNAYATTPQDDCVIFKQKIKEQLLQSPEIFYALNNPDLEEEVFDDDGTINYDGEWSRYFGVNILPYLFVPTVETKALNYLCYTISLSSVGAYSPEHHATITFTALCSTASNQDIDAQTGIARHDLLCSIIREKFNWTEVFGTPCKVVENTERVLDSKFIARTIVFDCALLSSYDFRPYNESCNIWK